MRYRAPLPHFCTAAAIFPPISEDLPPKTQLRAPWKESNFNLSASACPLLPLVTSSAAVVLRAYHRQTCPSKQLALRQELHWHLGRLALARLQLRMRAAASAGGPSFAPSHPGRTPMLRLAREAGENLTEAVKLAQATVEAAAAAAAAATAASSKGGRRGSVAAPWSAGVGGLAADNGMRAREGWARAELAKLCLTGVSPDFVRWSGV